MTAEIWLITLAGQPWLWVQDGLHPQQDRAFLRRHPDAVNVTAEFSHALVAHLTDVAIEEPDEWR